MTETDQEQPTFTRTGPTTVARMQRLLDETPAKVWEALTLPERIVEWLAPGEIELKLGGAAKLNFIDSGIVIDSQVSAFEDGRLLEYSWSGPDQPLRPLRFELTPEGEATRLTLTLTEPANEDVGRSCAGFAAHLEMLAAALAGVPIKFPFETFKAARDAYRIQLSAMT
ncbi:MAG: SRPBCC family protein [Caulobacteraceae bacterium]|jgi:uncharacterized protein YndB with AHSA1/START domain